MNNKVKLPNKASDLIDLALHDLELCERNSKYKINMQNWHKLKDDNLCHVCLAGSVIAQTLKYPMKTVLPCHIINYELELLTLDRFRIGDVMEGLCMYIPNKKYKNFDFNLDFNGFDYDYMNNKKKWKLRMRKLIRDLRKENL